MIKNTGGVTFLHPSFLCPKLETLTDSWHVNRVALNYVPVYKPGRSEFIMRRRKIMYVWECVEGAQCLSLIYFCAVCGRLKATDTDRVVIRRLKFCSKGDRVHPHLTPERRVIFCSCHADLTAALQMIRMKLPEKVEGLVKDFLCGSRIKRSSWN